MAQKQLSSDTQTDNNLQIASEQFQAFKKLTNGQLGQMSEIFGIMQSKLSEIELKVGTMGRSVDTVKNQRQASLAEPSQQIDLVELQTEVKLIRQNAFEEKQRREIANNEHQVLISQL